MFVSFSFSFLRSLFLLSLLIVPCQSMGVTPPIPVRTLDSDAMLGRWYQTHNSLVPSMSVEKDGYCMCSDYSSLGPRHFRVNSYENDQSPTGSLKQLIATAQSTNEPGCFDVSFARSDKQAQAVVILVGALGAQGRYEWVAITDPIGVNLFVLARDVAVFKREHERTALFQLAVMGFMFPFNRPRPTYHGSDCMYPPLLKGVAVGQA